MAGRTRAATHRCADLPHRPRMRTTRVRFRRMARRRRRLPRAAQRKGIPRDAHPSRHGSCPPGRSLPTGSEASSGPGRRTPPAAGRCPRLPRREKPGDDEQCDARPHRSVSASEQPPRGAGSYPEPARDRLRPEGRKSGADDGKCNDVPALGDLIEPLQDHDAVPARSARQPASPADSSYRTRRGRPCPEPRPRRRRARTFASRSEENGKAGQPRRAIASTSSLCTEPPPPKLFIASSWRISSASRL